MLLGCFDDHDPRGIHFKVTRSLLREIAVYRSWTVREVIRELRAGNTIKAGWYRYVWIEE